MITIRSASDFLSSSNFITWGNSKKAIGFAIKIITAVKCVENVWNCYKIYSSSWNDSEEGNKIKARLIIEEQLAAQNKDENKLFEVEKLSLQIKDKNTLSILNTRLMQIWVKINDAFARKYLNCELKFDLLEDILKACDNNQEIKERLLEKMKVGALKKEDLVEKANCLLIVAQFYHQYLGEDGKAKSENLLETIQNSTRDQKEEGLIPVLIAMADLYLQLDSKNGGMASKLIYNANDSIKKFQNEKFYHYAEKIIEFCGRNPNYDRFISDILDNLKTKQKNYFQEAQIYLGIVSAYIAQKKSKRAKEFLMIALKDFPLKSLDNLKQQVLFAIDARKINQQLKEIASNEANYCDANDLLINNFLKIVISDVEKDQSISLSEKIELLTHCKSEVDAQELAKSEVDAQELAKSGHLDPFFSLFIQVKDQSERIQCSSNIISAYIKVGNKDLVKKYFALLLEEFVRSNLPFENIKGILLKVKENLESNKIENIFSLLKIQYFRSHRDRVENFFRLYQVFNLKKAQELIDQYEAATKKNKIKISLAFAIVFGSVALISHKYL